jgi:uncharacterized repeat protein (TIGR01451 family)
VLVTSHKAAAPGLFRPDQAVSYTVTISNTGNGAAIVDLVDHPPEGMALLVGTLAATGGSPPSYDGEMIHWSGTVPPGDEVHLTYALSMSMVILPGAPLTNTVTISGSVLGPLTRQVTVVPAHLQWLPSLSLSALDGEEPRRQPE